MTSKQLEKQIQAIAVARGIPADALVAETVEHFLVAQPRRNSKGFIIPSFAGAVEVEQKWQSSLIPVVCLC